MFDVSQSMINCNNKSGTEFVIIIKLTSGFLYFGLLLELNLGKAISGLEVRVDLVTEIGGSSGKKERKAKEIIYLNLQKIAEI
jgi:hypothetical protein